MVGGDSLNSELHGQHDGPPRPKTKILTPRSQGLRVSRSQGLKVRRSEGLKVPRSQSLKVSRSQGLKVSKSQGPKVSKSQGPKVPRFQGRTVVPTTMWSTEFSHACKVPLCKTKPVKVHVATTDSMAQDGTDGSGGHGGH